MRYDIYIHYFYFSYSCYYYNAHFSHLPELKSACCTDLSNKHYLQAICERSGMMSAKKKGFVLYFDSQDALETIEASQRGELLLALYRYALAVCQEDISPAEFICSCDELDGNAKTAFSFMAGNIRRDTAKWLSRQEKCRTAAMQNLARSAQSTAVSSRAAEMKKYL